MTPHPAPPRRRGALLLLVLSVLTLFMLVGTVMLTLATRARTTSRAFATVTAGTTAGPMLSRDRLEQALLRLVRGGTDAEAGGLSESLLGDMYGPAPPLSGTVTSLTPHGVLLEATIAVEPPENQAEASPVQAADLCGRVLTFTPAAESGDSIMSLRILRASGQGPFTCWIARLQADPTAPLPRVPCRLIINQPAFRSEAYDAYDEANPWLTKIALENGRVASVPRPAFQADDSAPAVDNDNDGVKDGVWLMDFLDSLPAPGGGQLHFDVSYLILDLDSRINVNAHGSRTSIDFPELSGNDPGPKQSGIDWSTIPLGSGYGTADVDASLVFADPASQSSDSPGASAIWRRLVGDQTGEVLTATEPTAEQRRPAARVGSVTGRYGARAGSVAQAGDPGNDLLSQRNELVYGDNPLVDLKSMIKTQLETADSPGSGGNGNKSTSPMPAMIHYCPEWPEADFADDPYELRLDDDASRPSELRSGPHLADNPFTLAELETVLRQFDGDMATLPQRLAVVLDDVSQRSRLLVTTDSWDTPALTGNVAQKIEDYLRSLQCDPAEVMSPDVLAGLRFDINRPFPTGTAEMAAKQEFCKHLYTLLVALGQPADATTAQWAANVVDYRDPDSVFTRFQFDTNPADGWGEGTDGWDPTNFVWGIERPELLIAQTVAFYVQDNTDESTIQDALYVSLYRPSWTEARWDRNGLVETGTSEPIDLAEKSSQSSQPVWRLRIEPGTTVRFDKPGSGEKAIDGVFRKTGGGSGDAVIGPDDYLVVMPEPQKSTGKKNFDTAAVEVPTDQSFIKFQINSGGTFKAEQWPGAASYQSGADSIVFLERLEDPSKPWDDDPTKGDAYNPYVILDRLGIKRVNRTGENAKNWKTFIREHLLWNNGPFETVGSEAGIVPLDPSIKSWLPWANRAYISQAELLLVPQGGGAWRYWDYDTPKKRKERNVMPFGELPTPEILEATIVPSRFVGSQVSVLPATLAPVGMQMIPYNQLSRGREPGRLNFNTIVPNTGCDNPEQDNAVWWAALGPDAAVSFEDFAAGGPATSIRDLLTLMQDEGIYLDTAAAAGVKGNSWKKNRPYELDPSAAYATAIRLGNIATVRSHMFAVWITLRIRDTSVGGSESYRRLFAIVDRSRPVGFSPGQDLNVRDTIRILRFVE